MVAYIVITLAFAAWGMMTYYIALYVSERRRDAYWQDQLALALARLEGEPRSPNMDPAIYKWLSAVMDVMRSFDNDRAAAQTAMSPEGQKGLLDAKEAVDNIALFLRENYQREIGLGYHSNRKLAEIVTGYLAHEREMAARQYAASRPGVIRP
jgi:hypothetical protein